MPGCYQVKKYRNRIFFRFGIKISDTKDIRRLCINLSRILYTNLNFFYELPISELREIINEVNNLGR